jgi:hypothetical protein
MDRRKRFAKWIPKLHKGRSEVAANSVSDAPSALEASSTNNESTDSPAKTSPSQKPETRPLGPARYRENTQAQYLAALHELDTALKSAGGVWKPFKTPKLAENTSQADIIGQLQVSINETSDAQTVESTNPEGWKKFKHTMKTVFVFTSPFAKVLLTIAKQNSLVYSPC